ncbi:unnamed protein product [Brassica oleracea var. botrytis]|uniref:(rape) hypothetical protein n=1 Tax=Brassica napus TaxID=3708 RepID=A0A816QDY8_BRANA|nr:unnamed protein product [Brassica napus]
MDHAAKYICTAILSSAKWTEQSISPARQLLDNGTQVINLFQIPETHPKGKYL